MLCQFRPSGERATLADYIDIPAVYPAGRLDADSEGLVLLTDHGPTQARLSSPRFKLAKTYLVAVERVPDEAALESLRRGVTIQGVRTRPAEARRVAAPQWLWSRHPPVRHRENVPTAWLEMELREGRNRQIRRMTAAVGHPTLRLVRTGIGPYRVTGLAPGEWAECDPQRIPPLARQRSTRRRA